MWFIEAVEGMGSQYNTILLNICPKNGSRTVVCMMYLPLIIVNYDNFPCMDWNLVDANTRWVKNSFSRNELTVEDCRHFNTTESEQGGFIHKTGLAEA